MTTMRTFPVVVSVIMLTAICCGPRRPPLPDRRIESYGQAAARRFRQGEFDAALRLYLKARSEAARFDAPELQARYTFNIGRVLYECMLFDSAVSHFSESALLFRQTGFEADAAAATLFEAVSRAYCGDSDTAMLLYEKAALRCSRNDSVTVRSVEMLLDILGGNTARAFASGKVLRAVHSRKKDQFAEGSVLFYMAMTRFSEGARENSALLLDSALAVLGKSPYRYRNWRVLAGRAIVAFCLNDSAVGERFYERAVHAAPDLVKLPDAEMIKSCPSRW